MRCGFESRELRLACADTTRAIQEKQTAVLEYRTRIDLQRARTLIVLRLRRFALLEWREQINRDGKKRGRVMFAGNFAHGLEEA